jgi:hypothetical protein
MIKSGSSVIFNLLVKISHAQRSEINIISFLVTNSFDFYSLSKSQIDKRQPRKLIMAKYNGLFVEKKRTTLNEKGVNRNISLKLSY